MFFVLGDFDRGSLYYESPDEFPPHPKYRSHRNLHDPSAPRIIICVFSLHRFTQEMMQGMFAGPVRRKNETRRREIWNAVRILLYRTGLPDNLYELWDINS